MAVPFENSPLRGLAEQLTRTLIEGQVLEVNSSFDESEYPSDIWVAAAIFNLARFDQKSVLRLLQDSYDWDWEMLALQPDQLIDLSRMVQQLYYARQQVPLRLS